jgi:predicted Zn-dependent protease
MEEYSAVGTRLGELLRQKGIENPKTAAYEARIKYLELETESLKRENDLLSQELSRQKSLIQTLFESAVQELKKDNPVDAMGLLQAFLIYEPENTKAMINLAVAYAELGYYDRAENTLSNVMKLEPDNETAKRNLAILSEA